MNSSSSKCLGIVMESADEGQALLAAPTPSLDGRRAKHELENQAEPNEQKQSKISEEEEERKGFKGHKRDQPTRVQRSRLSLITFLNNITAPSSRNEQEKNVRSMSVSSSAIQPPQPTNSGNQNAQTRAENSKSIDGKEHRPTKSYGGKGIDETTQQHQQVQNAISSGSIPAATANYRPALAGSELSPARNSERAKIGASGAASQQNSADKLSIKSGVSNSSSSGLSESQSTASSGKNMKARECPVCCVRQQPSNFQKLKTCSHLTCKSCLIKYLSLEIMESRTNISCPNCVSQLHASDIHLILENQPLLVDRYEMFSLRRALSADPDARWCPAPDCTYAVIAHLCAACPQLKCERCGTMFCYHCKNNWHPNQTCDQARTKISSAHGIVGETIVVDAAGGGDVVTKACPRCGVQIMKMNDGSCNHMQCVLCNAEFCWLCLKQINELHYLSPTGCTFWGKKPWTRKKKLLWQIGTLIGAPLGIALIAGLAVPGIICGVPIFVGRKTYQRFSNLSKTKRQLVTALSVFGSLIVSPVLAVMTVGVGVPIMLAYVYGVVPLSLCRNGACGGSSNNGEGPNGGSDDEIPYGEAVPLGTAETQQHTRKLRQHREDEKTSNKSSFHHRRQSIASSGLVSLTDKSDKPNTEEASIQAIAGSQYNFDNRSVHTVWSSGQYGGVQLGPVEFVQEATSYNNEDAENSSTLACCGASIVAQASERRSLTGSNGSFRNTRPRSSVSNSRGNSEETGKLVGKFSCKISRNNEQTTSGERRESNTPIKGACTSSSNSTSQENGTSRKSTDSRLTFRSFVRRPMNSLFGAKSPRNYN